LELTDYDLIQKCLAGQQEYFEELVTRYKKLIFSVVYNMINDKRRSATSPRRSSSGSTKRSTATILNTNFPPGLCA
jgi:hypothetical protein